MRSADRKLAEIERRLALANGKRQARTTGIRQVIYVVEQCLLNDDIQWSGESGAGTKYPAYTTYVLAFDTGRGVKVDVRVGPAYQATPGRAWKQFQPWNMSTRKKQITQLLKDWDDTLPDGPIYLTPSELVYIFTRFGWSESRALRLVNLKRKRVISKRERDARRHDAARIRSMLPGSKIRPIDLAESAYIYPMKEEFKVRPIELEDVKRDMLEELIAAFPQDEQESFREWWGKTKPEQILTLLRITANMSDYELTRLPEYREVRKVAREWLPLLETKIRPIELDDSEYADVAGISAEVAKVLPAKDARYLAGLSPQDQLSVIRDLANLRDVQVGRYAEAREIARSWLTLRSDTKLYRIVQELASYEDEELAGVADEIRDVYRRGDFDRIVQIMNWLAGIPAYVGELANAWSNEVYANRYALRDEPVVTEILNEIEPPKIRPIEINPRRRR